MRTGPRMFGTDPFHGPSNAVPSPAFLARDVLPHCMALSIDQKPLVAHAPTVCYFFTLFLKAAPNPPTLQHSTTTFPLQPCLNQPHYQGNTRTPPPLLFVPPWCSPALCAIVDQRSTCVLLNLSPSTLPLAVRLAFHLGLWIVP